MLEPTEQPVTGNPVRAALLCWTLLLGAIQPATAPAATPDAEAPSAARHRTAKAAAEEPERRFTFSGQLRSRFEYLDNTFRRIDPGTDFVHSSQLLLNFRLQSTRWLAHLELLDARMHNEQDGSPVGTDDVNVTEPLQAYLGWRGNDVLQADDLLDLKLGRFTMDLGSRRLVARNRFRNSINAFSGVHARWQRRDAARLQAFYTLPVSRLPNELDPEALRDERFELDRERAAARFWGITLSGWEPLDGYQLDLFVLGLKERDQRDVPSSNRDLTTIGYALNRRFRGWQINLEAAYQFGESRAGAVSTTDLTHRSWSLHSHFRRRFDTRFAPTLTLRYDYARGDRVPGDDRNERFDPLYGARRFEFGPSGLFGLFERSNILSPGVSVGITPFPRARLLVSYRVAWLANSRDALTTAGLRDPTGGSSDLLGQYIDYRLRWDMLPERLQLETGAAYLRKSRFFDQVDAPNRDNTGYAYLQATLRF